MELEAERFEVMCVVNATSCVSESAAERVSALSDQSERMNREIKTAVILPVDSNQWGVSQ